MTSVDVSAQPLKPAAELAQSTRRFPGESALYRSARNALLEEEIELRRHIERVAVQRRALPPGGDVPQNYRFDGEHGAATLSQIFGGYDTLVTYNWMFGPKRARPCPMCTSMLTALDGEMADILQRVAFAVIARSPLERLVAFKKERGWRHLRLYSSGGNSFNRDYANEDPTATTTPHSTCLSALAAPSVISGAMRWDCGQRTRARTPAAHRTRCRYGPCST
ncbi:putative dithiol-disulfide oxidoreductase (DUF899 family) [Paraburkholderia sp. GAS334]